MKTINICNELNLEPIKTFKNYLNPEYIYIPIINYNDLIKKVGDKILKGESISKQSNDYSSISGQIKRQVMIAERPYLEIENDYQENEYYQPNSHHLKNMSSETFLKYLKNDELKRIFNKKIDILYINCIDDDPYIYNKFWLLKNEMDHLLEMCKNLLKIFKIEKIVLVIKSNYQELIKNFILTIGEYGNIEFQVLDNIYPIGHPVLIKKLLVNKPEVDLINLEDIIYIIYQVKKSKPICEKYISINGNLINEPITYKVKIGTPLKELLKNNLKNDKGSFILNNALCGQEISLQNYIIDLNTNGIIYNDNIEIKELPCNNCGLCYEVCPVNINPLIKSDKCIKCGLCNYVCPAKINITERNQ